MTLLETLRTGKRSKPAFHRNDVGMRKHIQGNCRLYAGNPFALFGVDPLTLNRKNGLSIFKRAGDIDIPIDDPHCVVTSERTFAARGITKSEDVKLLVAQLIQENGSLSESHTSGDRGCAVGIIQYNA